MWEYCQTPNLDGNDVVWNSEAGRVRGVIVKKVVSDVRFKGSGTGVNRHLFKSIKAPPGSHKGSFLRHGLVWKG
jgi:hypothetical protein